MLRKQNAKQKHKIKKGEEMTNEFEAPVVEQLPQEELEAIETEYTIAPDGSVVEASAA